MFAVRAIPTAPCFRRHRAGVFRWRVVRLLQAEANREVRRRVICASCNSIASGSSSCSGTGFATIVVRNELSEGNVSRTASRTGTRRRQNPEVSRSGAPVAVARLETLRLLWPEVGLDRRSALRAGVAIFPASLEQDTAGLGSVWWWGCKRARHGCQSPFLHVGLDKNKTGLAKIHMNCSRAIGADGREKVGILDAVDDVVELFAVASKENAA